MGVGARAGGLQVSYLGGGHCCGWTLYSEVQCIMGNGHMGPPHGQTDRLMDRHV